MLFEKFKPLRISNETKLIIKKLEDNLIVWTITANSVADQLTGTSRTPMISIDLPIPFKRKVKTSFALTIDKTQGHTDMRDLS